MTQTHQSLQQLTAAEAQQRRGCLESGRLTVAQVGNWQDWLADPEQSGGWELRFSTGPKKQ